MCISLQHLVSFWKSAAMKFTKEQSCISASEIFEIKSPVEILNPCLGKKQRGFLPLVSDIVSQWSCQKVVSPMFPPAGIELKPCIFTFATLATGTHLSTVTWIKERFWVWEIFGVEFQIVSWVWVSWFDDHLTSLT